LLVVQVVGLGLAVLVAEVLAELFMLQVFL